jgi:hypothetical protein
MEMQLQKRLAVVVREGLKGNHLLFASSDLVRALELQTDAPDGRLAVDARVAGELGTAGLSLAAVGTIEEARELIEGLSPACRTALAQLYLRFLARCAAARGVVN